MPPFSHDAYSNKHLSTHSNQKLTFDSSFIYWTIYIHIYHCLSIHKNTFIPSRFHISHRIMDVMTPVEPLYYYTQNVSHSLRLKWRKKKTLSMQPSKEKREFSKICVDEEFIVLLRSSHSKHRHNINDDNFLMDFFFFLNSFSFLWSNHGGGVIDT